MASAVCLFSIALCGLDYVNQGVHQGIQEIIGYTAPNTSNNGNNANSGGQNWFNDLYYGRTTTPPANFPNRGSGFQNNYNSNDVPISPCPDIFYYELNGIDWTGIVSLQNLQNVEFVKLNLQMTIRAKVINVSI